MLTAFPLSSSRLTREFGRHEYSPLHLLFSPPPCMGSRPGRRATSLPLSRSRTRCQRRATSVT
ncbi:hypothetical protein BV22DRAFT_1036359 [Leucogyrophana mollusca]|uniref:Uncharacterized protein n=1 Tax=Leucogyrophana mollusca TaxID=85980 RepID=A0ACB8BC99_9AGAM|nr:hypothetical protein BV22DRAFT_1036359 [Leucogyrophana mollusca]